MQWYDIGNVATTLATSTTTALFEAMIMYWIFLCAKRATIMPMNSNCLNPNVCIWCTLSLTDDYACIYLFTVDHVMCSGSILLLQGKGKLILVYCCRSSCKKKKKKNFPVEIEFLKLDFHLGGIFVNKLQHQFT